MIIDSWKDDQTVVPEKLAQTLRIFDSPKRHSPAGNGAYGEIHCHKEIRDYGHVRTMVRTGPLRARQLV